MVQQLLITAVGQQGGRAVSAEREPPRACAQLPEGREHDQNTCERHVVMWEYRQQPSDRAQSAAPLPLPPPQRSHHDSCQHRWASVCAPQYLSLPTEWLCCRAGVTIWGGEWAWYDFMQGV